MALERTILICIIYSCCNSASHIGGKEEENNMLTQIKMHDKKSAMKNAFFSLAINNFGILSAIFLNEGNKILALDLWY
jgi:hypothetical protein